MLQKKFLNKFNATRRNCAQGCGNGAPQPGRRLKSGVKKHTLESIFGNADKNRDGLLSMSLAAIASVSPDALERCSRLIP